MQQNDESNSHAHLGLDSTECRKILLTAATENPNDVPSKSPVLDVSGAKFNLT